ncbi:hypothetical protein [Bradyrhizobium elkanii]
MRELGFEPATKGSAHFLHSITESQTAASFEIGSRLKCLEHVGLEEKSIPVVFDYRSRHHSYDLTPDIGPIGIGYGNDIFKFAVVEVDCAAEPLTTGNRHRQAIETKLAAYLAVLDSNLYKQHWGIPNCLALFTTTTETRMNNMRDLLAGMSDKYSHCFGFQVRPTILSASPKPPPGAAVVLPWSTVNGHINLGAL